MAHEARMRNNEISTIGPLPHPSDRSANATAADRDEQSVGFAARQKQNGEFNVWIVFLKVVIASDDLWLFQDMRYANEVKIVFQYIQRQAGQNFTYQRRTAPRSQF